MNRSILNFLNWSVRVGTLFGVPISLHISLIFFLWPIFVGHAMPLGMGLEYVVLIVLSILLHELGHALTAKHYGLSGLSIMLHGFGGFATSSGERTPKQALIITLAGPAVTLILGFACLQLGRYGMAHVGLSQAWLTQCFLLLLVGLVNLTMGYLNLLPMLPFDGGNAVRALFWMRMTEFKAMRAAAHIGLLVSPFVLIYGWTTQHDFFAIFGFIGLTTSVVTLLRSGGIRFGEFFADRKARKEEAEYRKRRDLKNREYLSDVQDRARKREEEERLRRLLGD